MSKKMVMVVGLLSSCMVSFGAHLELENCIIVRDGQRNSDCAALFSAIQQELTMHREMKHKHERRVFVLETDENGNKVLQKTTYSSSLYEYARYITTRPTKKSHKKLLASKL